MKLRLRNRLGMTPLEYKVPDIDAYDGLPYIPYPKYYRMRTYDLFEELRDWHKGVGRDWTLREGWKHLKTIPADEIDDGQRYKADNQLCSGHQTFTAVEAKINKRYNVMFDGIGQFKTMVYRLRTRYTFLDEKKG